MNRGFALVKPFSARSAGEKRWTEKEIGN